MDHRNRRNPSSSSTGRHRHHHHTTMGGTRNRNGQAYNRKQRDEDQGNKGGTTAVVEPNENGQVSILVTGDWDNSTPQHGEGDPISNVTAASSYLTALQSDSLLHQVVYRNDLDEVVETLEKHVDLLDNQNVKGDTPLHIAAHLGNLDIVRLLCSFGASLTIQNHLEKRPLDVAGSKEVELYLLACGDMSHRKVDIVLQPWIRDLIDETTGSLSPLFFLEEHCQILSRHPPISIVSRFPSLNSRFQEARTHLEKFLTSFHTLQITYLLEQQLQVRNAKSKASSLYSNVLSSKKKLEKLANDIRKKNKEIAKNVLTIYEIILLKQMEELSKKDEEILKLQEENGELRRQVASYKEEINMYTTTINKLEFQLQSMSEKCKELQQLTSHMSQNNNYKNITENERKPLSTLEMNIMDKQLELMKPDEVIKFIRQQKGYDLPVSEAMQLCLDSLYATLENALVKLSADIYSSDAHFVLELIQNADDNFYHPDTEAQFELELCTFQKLTHVVPAPIPKAPAISDSSASSEDLSLSKMKERQNRVGIKIVNSGDEGDRTSGSRPRNKLGYISIFNNEAGFTAHNVRSLCDVGSSSKTDVSKFIGRKGIGFKSVFRVCDTPCIFSQPFQFHFDATQRLGHIVPIWLNEQQLRYILSKNFKEPLWASPPLNNILKMVGATNRSTPSAGTTILLPLNRPIQLQDIVNEIESVDFTLLFLRKLRSLVFTFRQQDDYGVSENEMKRVITLIGDRDDIQLSLKIDTYFLEQLLSSVNYSFRTHSFTCNVPYHLRKKSDSGEGSDFRGMTTTIMLAFPIIEEYEELPFQMIYAFLPVHAAGFRFIIQADFELITSRQDVSRNRLFNIWLREQLALFFVDVIRKDDYVRQNMYSYLPQPQEIVDTFWKPFVDDIWRHMKEEACILSESGNLRSSTQLLVKPEEFGNLISNVELQDCLGLEWVSSTVDTKMATEKLHCKLFTLDHLLQCLESACFHIELKPIAWFLNLFRYLSSISGQLGDYHEQLVTLKIFPVCRNKSNHWDIVSVAQCGFHLYSSLPDDVELDILEDDILVGDKFEDAPSLHILHPESIDSSCDPLLS